MFKEGQRAFDRCDVKVVEFKSFVYKQSSAGEKALATNPSEDMRIHAGDGAVLHCPKTEDDKVAIESQYTNYPTRQAALKSVRKLAGDLMCKNCRFSSMTPSEVSNDRAAFARAETDRIEATIAYDAAMKELIQEARMRSLE